MPNGFAYVVLLSWPLVAILIFRALPIPKAIAWTIVAGYLFLPLRAGFDFPLLPPIDKTLVPSVSAAVMTLVLLRDPHAPRPELPGAGGRWLLATLFALLLVGPFITVLTNSDPVIEGAIYLPGLRFYDAFSLINGTVVMLIPFLLGRYFLAGEQEQVALLKILAVAGVIYSFPILFEVRMSPQLNTWIYGFFAHSFGQHMRGDGFRPIVFLNHGLWLAIFMAGSFLSAVALCRVRRGEPVRLAWIALALWLFVGLLFVKSLGAVLIVLAVLPFAVLAGARAILRLSAILAMIVLLYPLLRGADLVPVDRIETIVASYSAERAQSFGFRLDNEDQLLARANLKPLAGWGAWGRPLVYDEETGSSVSVTDGAWIIVIGRDGWLGYVATFGLLTLPMILLWFRRLPVSPAGAGVALVLAANLVDLLPNATLTPVTWLLAGAVAGQLGVSGSTQESPTRPLREPRRHSRGARPRAVTAQGTFRNPR